MRTGLELEIILTHFIFAIFLLLGSTPY